MTQQLFSRWGLIPSFLHFAQPCYLTGCRGRLERDNNNSLCVRLKVQKIFSPGRQGELIHHVYLAKRLIITRVLNRCSFIPKKTPFWNPSLKDSWNYSHAEERWKSFCAYRQGAVLFSALAGVLGKFGLFEEDDGLFAVSHIGDEELLLWGASVRLRRCSWVGKASVQQTFKLRPICSLKEVECEGNLVQFSRGNKRKTDFGGQNAINIRKCTHMNLPSRKKIATKLIK